MSQKERWIDNTKVLACLLVTLGHLMQSMAAEGIIPAEGFFPWFNKTVYYIHVPLFFLCSGYLHQKYTKLTAPGQWLKHILRKLVNLGVPYVTFSTAVWAIKTLLPGAGRNQVGGLVQTLLLRPTAPYWYLYCLFFLFLVVIPFRGRKGAAAGAVAALALKGAALFGPGGFPFAVSSVLSNMLWFVLGMELAVVSFPERAAGKTWFWGATGAVFLGLSLLTPEGGLLGAAMGVLGCLAAAGFFAAWERAGRACPVLKWLAGYTMPIFLMHSIFAAALRSLLLKMGVDSPWIQIPAGIGISIFGPVAAAWVMKKWKYPEFFLYPGKFIRIR